MHAPAILLLHGFATAGIGQRPRPKRPTVLTEALIQPALAPTGIRVFFFSRPAANPARIPVNASVDRYYKTKTILPKQTVF
jgi:hypothetical protein